MQYYQWTIGSTTVRNPNRLQDGLRILKKNFEGKEWGLKQQEKFFELLKENAIYEMEDDSYERMTSARKQEHARKWVSVLNQLGFCYVYQSSNKPVFISNAGIALIDNPDLEDEIFLRQLLKYQKPCILPKQNGMSFSGVSVLPFIVSLKIIYVLKGLSKEEISIFLNTIVKMDEVNIITNKIKIYRAEKAKVKGKVKRKELYFKTQLSRVKEVFKEDINRRVSMIKQLISQFEKTSEILTTDNGKKLLSEITKGGKGSKTAKAREAQRNIANSLKKGGKFIDLKKIFLDYYLPLKIATLKDYADLTARYLRKSGLFSINREKIVIISEKLDFIKNLLSCDWNLVDDKNYLGYLWDSTLPKLPSDNIDFLKNYVKEATKKEEILFGKRGEQKLVELIGGKLKPPTDLIKLKQYSKTIEKNILNLKEIDFYYSQGKADQIEDILNYYDLIINKKILGGSAYYPAYLEWNTWRVFLAINTLLNKPFEARNFNIDEELQPVDHAQGNKADMVFEYSDFIAVVEVTLSLGSNQWSAEAEPVPRHVAKIQYDNSNKDVFGVFVAPKIDVNTVLTFFNNRQYSINDRMIMLTIIPFTIDQIKLLLNIFKIKRFSIEGMKTLFRDIRKEIDECENALAWFNRIPTLIEDWSKAL
ncbi:AlwI family type II restriction endonuclease [Patescibacteria group bacterium]|nr:AlwI family type II restriction endonuclease [Patescibacteria group bacterium]